MSIRRALTGTCQGMAASLATVMWLGLAPAVVAEEHDQLAGPLYRTTIVVHQLDEAVRLFRDILGLRVAVDLGIDGPAVNRLLGTRDEQVRVVIFDVDGSPTGRIAVMAYEGSKRATAREEVTTIDPGAVVLVLGTPDIDEAYERVRAAGYTIVSAPQVVFERPDMVVQSREMIFMGPEGVAINLLQRGVVAPPVQQ